MPSFPFARGPAARRILALAALAAAAPALAQARRDSAAASRPAAPTSARAAAEIPLPPPPEGTALRPRRAAWLAVSAGPWAGFDAGQSAALLVDYGFLRTPAAWRRLELEVRLSVMVARPTEDTDLTVLVLPPFGVTPVPVAAGSEEQRAWVVEVVPEARLRLPVGPKFALLAGAGVGLAQSVERSERTEMFAGRTETTDNVTGLVLRVSAGMSFDLSARTRLLFQPVAFSLQLGPGFSAWVPNLGLAYRL